MTEYTTPITNLNGTSRSDLHEEWESARALLSQALEELKAATCHPRDFQFQESGTWLKAHQEKSTVLAYAEDALDLASAWVIATQPSKENQ
mgnify:CR=1 FL=1